MASRGVRSRTGAPPTVTVPAVARKAPNRAKNNFSMAVAGEAADAEDLALVQAERSVGEPRCRETIDDERRFRAGCRRQRRIEGLDLATGHQRDCFVLLDLSERADLAGVAEHRDPVGDADDLAPPMRGENHCRAARSQVAHETEQPFDFPFD